MMEVYIVVPKGKARKFHKLPDYPSTFLADYTPQWPNGKVCVKTNTGIARSCVDDTWYELPSEKKYQPVQLVRSDVLEQLSDPDLPAKMSEAMDAAGDVGPMTFACEYIRNMIEVAANANNQ